jgi:hypothetical protein
MSITPTGSPPWVRTVSFENYGGHDDKRDFGGQGAINPYTDVSAAEFSRMVSDVAAVVRTAAIGVLTVQCNDSSPAAPTVESINMMTGVLPAGYEGDAAPSGFPSLARDGDGHFTITMPSPLTDDYGVSAAVAIQNAMGTAHATSAAIVTCEITSATTIVVRVFTDTGGAIADALVTVELG